MIANGGQFQGEEKLNKNSFDEAVFKLTLSLPSKDLNNPVVIFCRLAQCIVSIKWMRTNVSTIKKNRILFLSAEIVVDDVDAPSMVTILSPSPYLFTPFEETRNAAYIAFGLPNFRE